MRKLAAAALTAALVATSATTAATAHADTAPVHLLQSASNFRDLGGYQTSDGQAVRSGLVYRSNSLANLTAADQQELLSLGVNLDVDLRNVQERSQNPDKIPAGVTYQVADVEDLTHGISFADPALIPLFTGLLTGLITGSGNIGQSIAYPFMVDFSGADRAYKTLLTGIANDTTGAAVFHCSSGKDRTGWGAAVLLTILGVPKATVYADYLASNTYLGHSDAVESSWLDEAFAEATKIYGSFDNYVHNGIGLDDATIAKLKTRLLV